MENKIKSDEATRKLKKAAIQDLLVIPTHKMCTNNFVFSIHFFARC